MFIIHEGLLEEAERLAQSIERVYGIRSRIIQMDLSQSWKPIRVFAKIRPHAEKLERILSKKHGKGKKLVITWRDLGSGDNDDEWAFGSHCDGIDIMEISTFRLRGPDSQPNPVVTVPKEVYLRRLEVLGLHEVGHDVIRAIGARHLVETKWVDKDGNPQPFGEHCTDNRCVMYGIADICSQPESEGYMVVGEEKRSDGGLDDLIQRLRPELFCGKCEAAMTKNSTN